MDKPAIDMDSADPIRLYTLAELAQILAERNMRIVADYANFTNQKSSAKEMQLNVYSIKQ